MIYELSGYKVGSKLELVEYLPSEGVGPRVAGNRSATCGELHNGVIVIRLVVDGLSRVVCDGYDGYNKLTECVIGVLGDGTSLIA